MKLNPTKLSIIRRLLVGGTSPPLLSILSRLEPADLSSLFAELNNRESLQLIEALLRLNLASEVLLGIPEMRLSQLLVGLDQHLLLSILVYSNPDDAAYFLGLLEKSYCDQLLSQLEAPRRQKIQQFLQFPQDSVGRIMQSQVFTLQSQITAGEGLNLLRRRAQEEPIYYIYCVNESAQLVGVLSLRVLATALPDAHIAEILKRDVITVTPETLASEAAHLVSHYGFIALPVIDKDRQIVGIVTVDDVLDIIESEATAKIYAQAGLTKADRVYTPLFDSVSNRFPWMVLNLILAGTASSVVSLFEHTMSQLILLASFNNVVAGLGGNTAIQSLTVMTRGLATDDFKFTSTVRAIVKESSVGIFIGTAAGVLAGVASYIWKGQPLVSMVLFIALTLNCFIGAVAGAVVPLMLKKFGRDPAIGSGVLVTMFTDILGFFIFLGIATLGLRLIGPG